MAAGQSALVGGVLLAIIEGVAAVISRSTAQTPREQALAQIDMEKKMRASEAAAGGKSFWQQLNDLSAGPVVPKAGEDAKTAESAFATE